MLHQKLFIILLAFVVIGCGKSSQKTVDANPALTDAQREHCVVTGEQVSTSLMKNLGMQLKAALSNGDPTSAVRVCQQVAQPITASTSGQFSGHTVSRTSLKIRNPINDPTEADRLILEKWQALADAGETLPEHEVVRGSTGTATYYRPILVQEVCVKCHGTSQEISPAVREALGTLYPEDKATDYKIGDLRGAFRVTINLEAAGQKGAAAP